MQLLPITVTYPDKQLELLNEKMNWNMNGRLAAPIHMIFFNDIDGRPNNNNNKLEFIPPY
jgi:hypothetical protein